MASSDTFAVSLERDSLSRSAVVPTRPEVSSNSQPVPVADGGDAVQVSVSTFPAPQQAGSGEASSSDRGSSAPAEQVSENIRKALDSIRNTQVTFDAEGSGSSLSFKVVDTRTGEVIQQFPLRIAPSSLGHRTELANKKGLLLEDAG